MRDISPIAKAPYVSRDNADFVKISSFLAECLQRFVRDSHSSVVTSDLAPQKEKADHLQGVSGTGRRHGRSYNFFILKILPASC